MTTGQHRQLLANVAIAVLDGEMKPAAAAQVIKALENLSVSLYSEIKYAHLLVQMGRAVPELGQLPMYGELLRDKTE